jgi:hypothetical protein
MLQDFAGEPLRAVKYLAALYKLVKGRASHRNVLARLLDGERTLVRNLVRKFLRHNI